MGKNNDGRQTTNCRQIQLLSILKQMAEEKKLKYSHNNLSQSGTTED